MRRSSTSLTSSRSDRLRLALEPAYLGSHTVIAGMVSRPRCDRRERARVCADLPAQTHQAIIVREWYDACAGSHA